ncbi:hypothetical protein HJFPF1_02684 [Paramyrothecium foliicola]|nr:hypothetical protein HJFPF1_02684 [Paramyrothecium foliicola]
MAPQPHGGYRGQHQRVRATAIPQECDSATRQVRPPPAVSNRRGPNVTFSALNSDYVRACV